jgi:GTP-binding protein HflX
MRAVDEVLEEIGAGSKPRLLALNKSDLLDAGAAADVALAHPDAVLVSAVERDGLDDLMARIEEAFEETLAEVELLVPYTQGARLHELHEVAGSLRRTDREDGVLVRAKVPVAELHRFDDLVVAQRG